MTMTMTSTTAPPRPPRPHRSRLPERPAVPRQQYRAPASSRGIVELMGRRPDLVGVYGPADVAAESVCWSV